MVRCIVAHDISCGIGALVGLVVTLLPPMFLILTEVRYNKDYLALMEYYSLSPYELF